MEEKKEKYICLLYVGTTKHRAGKICVNGDEIALLAYVVMNSLSHNVVGLRQYFVTPEGTDTVPETPQKRAREESDDKVEERGISLAKAITMFEEYVKRKFRIDSLTDTLQFVTDGQLPLRQWLYPKCWAQGISLPGYYSYFHDLRQEFQTFYQVPNKPESIKDMITILNQPSGTEFEFFLKEIQDMVTIVETMLKHGKEFDNPEKIKLTVMTNVFNMDDIINSKCVVRARGFHFSFKEHDLLNFFVGLNIADGGIAVCLDYSGRRNGIALVRFENQDHFHMAIQRDGYRATVNNVNRYVEVHPANAEDFIDAAILSKTGAEEFLSAGGYVIVLVRGLPYNCTAKDVVNFFTEGGNPCAVMGGEDGVRFLKKGTGEITDEALVMFAEEEDAGKALSKHLKQIGLHTVEVIRKTAAEVQEICYRYMNASNFGKQQTLRNELSPVLLKRKHSMRQGDPSYYIRLCKVPRSAQIMDIQRFLGRHAKHMIIPGMMMFLSEDNSAFGDIILQMQTKQSAFLSVQERHLRSMIVQQQKHVIEIYQCPTKYTNETVTEDEPPPKRPALPPPSDNVQVQYYIPAPILPTYGLANQAVSDAVLPADNVPVPYPPVYTWPYSSTSASLAAFYRNVPPPISLPATPAAQPVAFDYGLWLRAAQLSADTSIYFRPSQNAQQ